MRRPHVAQPGRGPRRGRLPVPNTAGGHVHTGAHPLADLHAHVDADTHSVAHTHTHTDSDLVAHAYMRHPS